MSNEFFASPGAIENPSPLAAEERLTIPRPKSPIIRFIAHLVSVVFHPLFITGYIVAFLLFVHPYVFSGFSDKIRVLRLISVVLLTAFFPAFVVLLLRQLGLIQSVYLRTQKDRIIPYIASMFFFFWIFYVSRNLRDSPPVFVGLLLGVFISSIAALMANIYFKVSMHGISMGAMICFFVWLAMQGNFSMGIYISVVILVAGIVCTSRLIVSDHYPFEVYAGLFLGVISQAVATVFV